MFVLKGGTSVWIQHGIDEMLMVLMECQVWLQDHVMLWSKCGEMIEEMLNIFNIRGWLFA